MPTIAEMRARLKANTDNKFQRDESVFAFWNMPYDTVSNIRLLPWVDPVTGMIWTEKQVLPMKFVDPQDNTKVINFKAPCREMYDPSTKCPVADVVRGVYNEAKELKNQGDLEGEKTLSKIASAHWKDFTYYYQGFVNKTSMSEEKTPENPIRRLPYTKQIQTKVTQLMFDENDPFDILPTGQFEITDLKNLLSGKNSDGEDLSDAEVGEILSKFEGYEFILKKTKKGDYADWTNSSFAKSKSTLSDDQLEALDKYGFHDLRKALPEQPSDEAYDILVEMISTSLDYARGFGDGLWNPEWEAAGFKPFRPKGGNKNESTDGEESKSSTIANRVKSTVAANITASAGQTTKASVNAASVAERLRKSRGATVTTTPAAEPVAETADEATPVAAAKEPEKSPEATTSTQSKVAMLASKIRAKAKGEQA